MKFEGKEVYSRREHCPKSLSDIKGRSLPSGRRRVVSPVRGKVEVHAVHTASSQSSPSTARTQGGVEIKGTAD